MYRRKNKGWLKHMDFIILDLLCLQVCFALAYFSRHGFGGNPHKVIYQNMMLVLVLFEFIYAFFLEGYKDILKRGYYVEFVSVVKQVCILELFISFYLIVVKDGDDFSRTVLFLLGIYQLGIGWMTRTLWKLHVKKYQTEEGNCSLLLITTSKMAEEALKRIRENNYQTYKLSGIVFMDCIKQEKQYQNIQIVLEENMAEWVCKNWVDEVLIVLPNDMSFPAKYTREFSEMGIVVHYTIMQDGLTQSENQTAEMVCGYLVLTSSIRIVSNKEYFMKRTLDIAGGLVGTAITLILILFLGSIIFIKSPGPIFFKQERVGQNGRKFNMYKFRTMYLDAEERKKNLLEQNQIADGMMFKMENDPRIIGSKIDQKTGEYIPGIGNWIRKLSLDEFPQFFNVLRGDMSLVGTRPPTVDEYEKYKLHHKARLSVKPGITGLWQVSGRSEITDFEEVVKLDTEYICHWSMANDIKILFRTVQVVISGKGSM